MKNDGLTRIFTKRIAVELINKGFSLLDMEKNYKNDKLNVYIFKSSKELNETLTHLSNNVKMS